MEQSSPIVLRDSLSHNMTLSMEQQQQDDGMPNESTASSSVCAKNQQLTSSNSNSSSSNNDAASGMMSSSTTALSAMTPSNSYSCNSERAVNMSTTYTSEKAVAMSNTSINPSLSVSSSQLREIPPSVLPLPRRDALHTATVRSSMSLSSQMKMLRRAGFAEGADLLLNNTSQQEGQAQSIGSSHGSSPQSKSERNSASRPTSSTVTTTTCPQSRRSSGSSNNTHLDEIRASISELKNNGVGGIGKSTSTLVRNEETGRYVILDVDDDHFDGIIMDGTSTSAGGKVIEEDEGGNRCCSSEGEGELWAVENSRSSSSYADSYADCWPSMETEQQPTNITADDNTAEQQNSLFMQDISRFNLLQNNIPSAEQKQNTAPPKISPTTSPAVRVATPMSKFMMANRIISESMLDDDVVDDAVWAATQCSSTASTSSYNDEETKGSVTIETANKAAKQEDLNQQQSQDDVLLFADEHRNDDDEQEFFAIRSPSSQWNAKWSIFEQFSDKSSLHDDFNILRPGSEDEWGVHDGFNDDDNDSFAPGPEWD